MKPTKKTPFPYATKDEFLEAVKKGYYKGIHLVRQNDEWPSLKKGEAVYIHSVDADGDVNINTVVGDTRAHWLSSRHFFVNSEDYLSSDFRENWHVGKGVKPKPIPKLSRKSALEAIQTVIPKATHVGLNGDGQVVALVEPRAIEGNAFIAHGTTVLGIEIKAYKGLWNDSLYPKKLFPYPLKVNSCSHTWKINKNNGLHVGCQSDISLDDFEKVIKWHKEQTKKLALC